MKKAIRTKFLDFNIVVSKPRDKEKTPHFLKRLKERDFDLGPIVSAYAYVVKNASSMIPYAPYEITTGLSTVTFSLNKEKDTIQLITGWEGNRKHI